MVTQADNDNWLKAKWNMFLVIQTFDVDGCTSVDTSECRKNVEKINVT